jgi:hypothetical protein
VTEEYLTVEQLAARLGWSPKTVRNKMAPGGIFKKGVHYSEARGLPVLFRWSRVLALYPWADSPTTPQEPTIPMARGYEMK